MQRVEIEHPSSLSPEALYDHLAEHENLGALFGARITRVRDGDTERNGVGSVRSLRLGPLPAFEETVTAADRPRLIEYRITRGSPLKGHRGRMEISPRGEGSLLRYTIEFGSVVPGLDRVVKVGLDRSIRRGLRTLG